MKNFTVLGDGYLQTPYGIFGGVSSHVCRATGELEGLSLSARNVLLTHAGELTPFFTETPRRKRKYAVAYHKNGMVKSVSLEAQQEVVTPIGGLPAELVTFYDTGELCRVFPLDGKLSGFWREEDERSLQTPLSFDLGFVSFTAAVGCLCFYKSGRIRSVTLFPGETVAVQTAYGAIPTQVGFSLYEDGALASLEPAVPVPLPTPLGTLTAFQPNAAGVSADANSLTFTPDGQIRRLSTVCETIVVSRPDGTAEWISPRDILNPLDGETYVTQAISIQFLPNQTVSFDDSAPLSPGDCSFTVIPYRPSGVSGCSPVACASCQLGCGAMPGAAVP
ncbi:MAG: hypothetical protein LBC26_05110 [Oscillospiraceae bacterium]|jgi:hypothetical protein|nr:hypothetical protein [Oscillospiraceae bacterium]